MDSADIYRSRTTAVAVRWTGGNLREVRAAVGRGIAVSQAPDLTSVLLLIFPGSGAVAQVAVGQWIVRGSDFVQILDPGDFSRAWELLS
ncbi:MAG: hypothetical protein QOI83_3392 [Streptomycetaceae bacterium]|nr:hypothetical protein [Streptomycetaceae bacterium]